MHLTTTLSSFFICCPHHKHCPLTQCAFGGKEMKQLAAPCYIQIICTVNTWKYVGKYSMETSSNNLTPYIFSVQTEVVTIKQLLCCVNYFIFDRCLDFGLTNCSADMIHMKWETPVYTRFRFYIYCLWMSSYADYCYALLPRFSRLWTWMAGKTYHSFLFC